MSIICAMMSPGAAEVSKCQLSVYWDSVPPAARGICSSQTLAAAISCAWLTVLSFRPQVESVIASATHSAQFCVNPEVLVRGSKMFILPLTVKRISGTLGNVVWSNSILRYT